MRHADRNEDDIARAQLCARRALSGGVHVATGTDYPYYRTKMKYTWNPAKAASNRVKHRVDFADAIAAIEDPNRIEVPDDRFDYDEDRLQVIGAAARGVLFVVTTMRGETTCRIISARKATPNEQRRYYGSGGDRESW